MKYIILTIALSILFVFQGIAQRNQLNGPAAKNYKVRENKTQESTTVLFLRHKKPQGPAAKNFKQWEQNDKIYHTVEFAEREDMKGPNAKNRRYAQDGHTEEDLRSKISLNIWQN